MSLATKIFFPIKGPFASLACSCVWSLRGPGICEFLDVVEPTWDKYCWVSVGEFFYLRGVSLPELPPILLTMLKILLHIISLNAVLRITPNIVATFQTLEIIKARVISEETHSVTIIGRIIHVFLLVVVLSPISPVNKLLVKSATIMIMKQLTVHKEWIPITLALHLFLLWLQILDLLLLHLLGL